ncbi:MAG: UDP-glucuronate 4-epimerase [Parasphingorhabdus sp.]|jgi:UDP-glucuronate 4-epimerase
MSNEVFLVTGAMGCIGTWVLRHLLDQKANVLATDLSETPERAHLVMTEDEVASINWAKLDVTDHKAVNRLVADNGVTHIVHLAGLQIPFCKANPVVGAAVNVLGTVNVLEAARHNNVQGISYASSLAALGPDSCYPDKPVKDDVTPIPVSLYGVYKVANEGTAKIYWQDWQIGSVGLRPYIVYGVARDQGMTSDIAKAVLAAAAGKPYHIRFSGQVALQYASDTAETFIHSARANYQGSAVCNLRGDVLEVSQFVDILKQICPSARITFEASAPLPFPSDLDDSGIRSILGSLPHTPLEESIKIDLGRFENLLSAGKVNLSQLEN